MVSLDVPKVLSSVQRDYIVNQIEALNNAIYGNSSAALEQILDIKEAAKYYLVQEIMEDCESYHGSCKLYKDRDSLGTVDKWKFGPVWDFGNAYDRHAFASAFATAKKFEPKIIHCLLMTNFVRHQWC